MDPALSRVIKKPLFRAAVPIVIPVSDHLPQSIVPRR